MSVTLQKANFWKRISAFLFDFIVTIMLTFAFATAITVLCDYDKTAATVSSYYTQYEEIYGIDFDISEENFNNLSVDQQAVFNDAYKALYADEGFQDAHQKMFSLTMLIAGGGLLLATLLWYFVIPLLFGYGRTMGKKIFGLAVIHTNFLKMGAPILFIRSIIGLFAIETMLPLSMLIMIEFSMMGIVGLITIGLLGLLQVGVMIYTNTNSSIHDLLTDTVVVEFASQRIFDTHDELLQFKQEEHAKAVENAEYGRFQNTQTKQM